MILNIIDRGRAILSARPSSSLLALTRRLEGRRKWLKAGGLSIEPSRQNIDILRDAIPGLVITGSASRIRANDALEGARNTLGRHKPKFHNRPFPLQRRALRASKGRPAFAYFMEQGTGKTYTALRWAGRLWHKGTIDLVLVVAPKGVHRQWVEKQIPRHLATPYRAACWAGSEKGFVVPREHKRPDGECIEYLTINYEALIRSNGMTAVMEQLEGVAFALVIDESHKAKNATSQRWSALWDIRDLPGCRARLLMTGTPIAKNLLDEWAQLKLLDPDIIGMKYAQTFKNEYCITTGPHGSIVIGSRNVERFREITAPFVFRALKSELGIAPKLFDEWVFDMTKKQRRIYRDMARELIAYIETGEVTTAVNAMVKLNRLQQISNGFIVPEELDDNGERIVHPPKAIFKRPEDNPRVAALLELLESTEEHQQTIIWARYREDVETVSRALLEPLRVLHYGATRAKARARALDAWKSGEVPYLIATPGTMGTGTDDLQHNCSRAIYYSNSENSIDRWQSEDRIHRIGTTGSVLYIDLIAAGSRDRSILANLRAKKSLSDLTLDDIRETILNDVLSAAD